MTTSCESVPSELLDLERNFWHADGQFYRAHVDEPCLLVFQGFTGLLSAEEVTQTIEGGPRWQGVEISGCKCLVLTRDAVLALSYTAHARRGSEAYRALVTSIYRKRDTGWKLALHQHTPLG